MNDEYFLQLALNLAGKGAGSVSPNPLVGCVLVKNGKVISEGYHQQFGGPHAEVIALNNAVEPTEGAALYVTLEPCSHFGKTPPCTDLIIAKGIRRVVVGTLDPNPLVSGSGVRKLREAGIEVNFSVLENECKEQNKFFLKHITTGLPYILVKTAASLNGMVNRVSGRKAQLTGSRSVKMVHQLRGEYDLILTGSGTVLADKPKFTVRKVTGRNPAVAILDSSLRIKSIDSILSSERDVYIFTAENNPEKTEPLRQKGVKVITVYKESDGRLSLAEIISHLGQAGISSIMVEAGPRLVTSFLESGLTDEFLLFLAPELIAGGDNFIHPSFYGIPPGAEIFNTGMHQSGSDFYLTFRTEKSFSHVYRPN